MIIWRNYLSGWAKAVFAVVFLVFVLWLVTMSTGCNGPVIPKSVASSTIAYENGEQNAGVLKSWPGKGALITDKKKAEYDALVAYYGRGTVGHPLIPPVLLGDGLVWSTGKKEGFPRYETVWFIEPEALEHFILFKEWQRSGREPLK